MTAFVIESHKNLQQQPEDLTNHILKELAVQISHISINGNFVNSTVPDFTMPSFQKSTVDVAVNTLWVLSLLIALITASLGILVKQWFHELLSYETHDPMERLKLRFFREAGVERWKVFAIASSLPLLLQLALLLFFVGLGLFFHRLDAIVSWFTTGTAVLWLVSLLFATLAPTFSSQCPYKTPFLKIAVTWLRLRLDGLIFIGLVTLTILVLPLYFTVSRVKNRINELIERYHEWKWRMLEYEEGNVCKNTQLGIPVISYARDLLQGERLHEAIAENRKSYGRHRGRWSWSHEQTWCWDGNSFGCLCWLGGALSLLPSWCSFFIEETPL